MLVAAAVAPVALAGDPCFHSFDNRPPVSEGTSSHVSIQECWFGPTITRVAVGDEVVWQNASSQPHEVVGANLAWGAHAKLLEPGDSIGWTFTEPGIHPYSCMLHPGMTGAVVVGDVTAAGIGAPGAAGVVGSDGQPGEGPTTVDTGASVADPNADPAPGLVVASVGAAAIALVGAALLAARLSSRPRVAAHGQDPVTG